MKKVFLLLLIGLLNFGNYAFSSEETIKALKKGGKIIFIRHAIAPGNGDPDNINLKDCNTQRNLSKEGIKQSEKIGKFFRDNKIKIDKILSSEWCRCKDTAKFAFNNYKILSALNSFYDEKFAHNEDKQIHELKSYIEDWKSNKNLVLVTHYVVISAMLNRGVSSGEIVVSDKRLNIIGSILTN